MADETDYEGQFIQLADTGDENVPLTKADLDAMVKNFQPRSIADHIPVRFGRANSDGPVVARVSALRRDGATLSGKLTGVDPRFDQLLKSKKLGGRTARSMRFERDPEKGASLTGYGFMPPRVYGGGGGMHEGDSTEAGLSKLASADSAGDVVQFSSGDAGRVEFIIADGPMRRSAAQPCGEMFRFETNSERLSDLAKKRAREDKISFGDALSQVAEENHELTLPDRVISFDDGSRSACSSQNQGETFRFERNSERLSDLAKKAQREQKISFAEALAQVVEDHPELTLPDQVISFEEEDRPKSNSQQLSDLAKQRSRQDKISFGEALSQVATENPELTR